MPINQLERVWRFQPEGRNKTLADYDHFYSGQDCFVFIVPRTKKLIPIPVTGFGFGMSQEKVPIFGAWSYVWDAVANGTRMVQGQMSLIFSEPNHIGKLLGDDADRANASSPIEIIDQDNVLKQRSDLRSQIWGVSGDVTDIITNPHSQTGTLKNNSMIYSKREAFPFGSRGELPVKATHSGHPTFDIMIAFGTNPDLHNRGAYGDFDYNTWLARADDVGRLYSTANDQFIFSATQSPRIYIEDVQLLSCGITADTSGQPLQETYSFMARDASTPNVT